MMTTRYWPVVGATVKVRVTLPLAGTTVTFSLARDGVLVQGYPLHEKFDVATKCVHGNVSPGYLPAGSYRLDVEPDTARAVSGTFTVR